MTLRPTLFGALALIALAAAPALACDIGFADEAAFKARWESSPAADPTKVDDEEQRFLFARCRSCVPALLLALRATTLSSGADLLSKSVTDLVLDDPGTRRGLLQAYEGDQVAVYGRCIHVSFAGRRKLDGATFAAINIEGNGCPAAGFVKAVEYLGAKGNCGFRVKFTWSSFYAMQDDLFAEAHWLLQQLRWKP